MSRERDEIHLPLCFTLDATCPYFILLLLLLLFFPSSTLTAAISYKHLRHKNRRQDTTCNTKWLIFSLIEFQANSTHITDRVKHCVCVCMSVLDCTKGLRIPTPRLYSPVRQWTQFPVKLNHQASLTSPSDLVIEKNETHTHRQKERESNNIQTRVARNGVTLKNEMNAIYFTCVEVGEAKLYDCMCCMCVYVCMYVWVCVCVCVCVINE